MLRNQLKLAIISMMGMNLDTSGVMKLQDMNRQFMETARGKGKSNGSHSIAMQARRSNPKYPKPHQGAQECARRLSQSY